MTLPELAETLKAIGPAVAGIASLIHPLLARLRRRRREATLQRIVQAEVQSAARVLRDDLALEIHRALHNLEARLAQVERPIGVVRARRDTGSIPPR